MRNALAALALLGLLGTSCAGPSEPPPSSIQALDRTRILAAEANLKGDPELASSNIQVSAHHRTVVLTGTVPSEEAKVRAGELAGKVEGVETVENLLKVKPPGT